MSSCTIPDKRRSESSLKIARRSSTWSNMWDGSGHVQPGRLSSSRKRCTRGHLSRIGRRSTSKRCRECRTKCLQNEVGGTSAKSEEYASTKVGQVSARERCKIRSTRSRHAHSADGGPTRSNSEPKIHPNYIPCGQGITDTCIIVGHNYNFMQRARLGERMFNEQMAVLQTTAQILQEFCNKVASDLGGRSTGRQE